MLVAVITFKVEQGCFKMRKKSLFSVTFSALLLVLPFFAMIIVPVNAETSWVAPTRITFNGFDDYQVVVAHQGIPHVTHIAWVQDTGGLTTREIWYANSTNWTNHVQITSDSLQDYNPMIDVDCCGTVHIAWVKEAAIENSDIFIFL